MPMTNWLVQLIGETQAKLLALVRRSPHTITGLAKALRLTDNAVRSHVAVLRRDGIVADVGSQRDTGGKPARVYGLTPEGEELFPKAYALVLGQLVEEIIRRDGRERAVELLRAVGARAAAGTPPATETQQRAETAAAVFRGMGADVDVQPQAGGWRLRAHGCPLSAVTAGHPEVCELGKALVEAASGARVTECCERGAHPRCAFSIETTA